LKNFSVKISIILGCFSDFSSTWACCFLAGFCTGVCLEFWFAGVVVVVVVAGTGV
jgi:hypothetical protein